MMNVKNSLRINDERQLSDSPAASSSPRFAPTNKDVMIGFDDHLMAIKTRLCGESTELQVIPIFGMGGIGKTTLARNAYNDLSIRKHFDILAWVTVKQEYSIWEILSSLLNFMKKFWDEERSKKLTNEEKVYKSLKGRRYLVVMDDMWSTEVWDDVWNLFPNDNNGSRIMLTTRLSGVAAYPQLYSPIYEICFMDADQSWDLLQQRVFADQDCPQELENIGKDIARSCRGLPLAIVVIAGLLSTVSENPASWGEIAENINSVIAAKDGQFEEILSLSYTHLPHHLKPCFLYMGGFPEDYEVRVSKLIKLWVAEDFITCPNGSKSLENEAEEFLEDLVKRSLVLVTKRKSNGKIKSCSLHDLMRDLCIRKANEEKFLLHIRSGYVEKELLNQRRIIIAFSESVSHLLKISGSSSTIHTIMCFLNTSLLSLNSVRLLKVLEARDVYIKFPAQLFDLLHLKYLAISYPATIPAAISKLQNLQTLIIRPRGQCKFNDCLPQEIWRMPKLRHLLFYGTLPSPEITTPPLDNLQTLLLSLSDSVCTEGIMKMIPNLKKLKINYYDRVAPMHLNLACLHQLENLEIRSHSIFAVWQKGNFALPQMLKKLTLSGLLLPWNEMTSICCSLPNLQVLKIKDYACGGSRWEITEEEFPQLEFLLIEDSSLYCWIADSTHFPKLKFLLLHKCMYLKEIPDDFGEIPTLELIEIRNCRSYSLQESAKRILEEQQSLENCDLQVRIY